MPRGRKPAEQQELENKQDWAEGELRDRPGANIDQAAEGETPQQPHLPGQSPTMRDNLMRVIQEQEKRLSVIEGRRSTYNDRVDAEAVILKRNSAAIRQAVEQIDETLHQKAELQKFSDGLSERDRAELNKDADGPAEMPVQAQT